jgi:hypothetical protein
VQVGAGSELGRRYAEGWVWRKIVDVGRKGVGSLTTRRGKSLRNQENKIYTGRKAGWAKAPWRQAAFCAL